MGHCIVDISVSSIYAISFGLSCKSVHYRILLLLYSETPQSTPLNLCISCAHSIFIKQRVIASAVSIGCMIPLTPDFASQACHSFAVENLLNLLKRTDIEVIPDSNVLLNR